MAEQPSLGTEARRRNVRKVREALTRLKMVEDALIHMQAELPRLQRETADAREKIEAALPEED